MLWEGHRSKVLVASHRGERFTAPENTITAFRRSIDAGVDMIETDVRMTADHELVLMHDADVTRTTDGTGLICDMTLKQFKSLNAAHNFEEFAPEAAPTLEEFLKLCALNEDLLINFELKEYPTPGREAFAYECCDRTIDMLEKYGFGKRCVLNSFSGKLLEYIDEKYEHRYRLHGFYPYPVMADMSRDPRSYLWCLCISSVEILPDGTHKRFNFNVPPKRYFDDVRAAGIEPWVCAGIYSEPEIVRSAQYGASLITTDYPAMVLSVLRKNGYHD
jgi:glycerophosphoryl diester phosphodiesterase